MISAVFSLKCKEVGNGEVKKKVKVSNYEEMAKSERNSHSKNLV